MWDGPQQRDNLQLKDRYFDFYERHKGKTAEEQDGGRRQLNVSLNHQHLKQCYSNLELAENHIF